MDTDGTMITEGGHVSHTRYMTLAIVISQPARRGAEHIPRTEIKMLK